VPADADPAAPPAYPIGSVDNALRLLAMLRTRSAITVSEAAAELGVARSTAHRLLGMLRHHGFVRQDPGSRAYLPGRALLEIGLSVVERLDVRVAARPVLEALSRELRETVHLAVLDGGDCLFADSVESTATIRVSSRIGAVMPAPCTAAGKAMLAALEPAEVRARLGGRRPRRMTERSLSSVAALEEELAGVRARGYATNLGESEAGLCAVAAAIDGGRAAITVSVPGTTIEPARLEEIAAAVRRAAAVASEALVAAAPAREPEPAPS
jgi:DNA-binding IclR family transcriptional regulator